MEPQSLSRRLVSRIPPGLRQRIVTFGYFRGPRYLSRLRQAWVIFRNPDADIRFGHNNYLGPGFSLHMPGGGTFITGDNVEFRRGFRAEIAPEGRLSIGTGSYLTYDVIILCSTVVEIGERCGLAQSTLVVDGAHKYRDLTVPFLDQGYNYRPIRIEDDAQIHSKCTITNGIGTRAIIGANSVVTRPIPPYTLAAGSPAKVLEYFGPPENKPTDLDIATG